MSFIDVALRAVKGALGAEPGVSPAPQDARTKGPEELGGDVVIEGDPNRLDQDLQLSLLSLARSATEPSDIVERLNIQRVRRSREYMNGKMNGFYAEDVGAFLPINRDTLSAYGANDDDEDAEPLLGWPLYQATGLYIIAVLSGGPPTVRFFPANADNGLDVATAKAANTITELFYRTNDIDSLIAREAQLLYTDGVFFAYVRHVLNAQRFGTHEEDVIEPVDTQLSPDTYGCVAGCGTRTDGETAAGQIAAGGESTCQACGAPIDAMSFQAGERAMVPQKVGTKTVANGAELLDIYGKLEVTVPPAARDLASAQWLRLRTDVDVSELRFEYQDMADSINPGEPSDGTATEARLARISAQAGGWQSPYGFAADDGGKTCTYTRIWLRPSIFFRLSSHDDKRDRLLKLFPDGVYVAYVGNTLLRARSESLDKYWVECHAYPGIGQVRPAIGDCLLDAQDALNDLMDSELSNARLSSPSLFVDSKTVDPKAWMQARQRGGNTFPVTRQGGEDIGSNFFQATPSGNNPGATALREWIFGPGAQYLSATLPGMTGQSDPNLKTARAYAQAKEQAMGRIGIVWRAIKQAHVEIVTKAVRLYIDFRTMDVTLPQITPAGFANEEIRLDDLHGQIVAYPESDEAYPMSAADKRQVFEALLQNPDPSVHGIAVELDNLEYAKGTMGWAGLVMPGEKSRAKQMAEIQELLAGQPIQNPPPMGPVGPPPVDPFTGAPLGPPPMGPVGPPPPPLPSVPIDKELDEHPVELKTIQSWMHSAAGLAQKGTPGYENVRLHGVAHFQAMQPPQPQPPPPEPIVVANHLVAPTGDTVWSPPGEGPGAPGMQGAVGQPTGEMPKQPAAPPVTIHQPGSNVTIHQPGSISAPAGPPKSAGLKPTPQPGAAPKPQGPPTAAPPPSGPNHPGLQPPPSHLKPF